MIMNPNIGGLLKMNRFYEVESIFKGYKVILDSKREYTFPPLNKNKNHMFLKALNKKYENTDIDIVLLKDNVNYYQNKAGACEEELLDLRRENNHLVKSTAEIISKHDKKVFDWIDNKLLQLEYTDTVSIYPRESVQILKELKEYMMR